MAAVLQVSRASGLQLALFLALFIALLHMYRRQRRAQKRTVMMTLQGRLGNQLFQVAAGEYFRRAASNEGIMARVVFKRNSYNKETDLSGGLFRDLPHFDSEEEACRGVPTRGREAVEQVRYSCDLIPVEKARGECTVVQGFFQCPEYAAVGRSKVLSLIEGADEYPQARRKYETAVRGVKGDVVAVHVRRGDYTKRFNRGLLEPVEAGYYVRAAKRMPTGATFLVFSDDLEWCRNELGSVLGEARVAKENVVFVTEKSGLASLIMMMLADHNIIANSTFSWWAAFLNHNTNRIVCAPKRWFGSRVKGDVHIYPENWIRL